eukprot:scaffold33986_cov43-Phaeocystis_antarctica.AAC.2
MLTLLSLGTAGHLVAPRSLALATSPRAAVSMVAAERGTSAKEELLSLSQEGLKPMDDGAPHRTTSHQRAVRTSAAPSRQPSRHARRARAGERVHPRARA